MTMTKMILGAVSVLCYGAGGYLLWTVDWSGVDLSGPGGCFLVVAGAVTASLGNSV